MYSPTAAFRRPSMVSTNCAGLSGNVSTIVMTHIWVEATITGLGTFVFDPARKVYEKINGIGLSTLKNPDGIFVIDA